MEIIVSLFVFVVMMVWALVIGMGIGMISLLIHGYVFSVLWRWFMIPTLGLPELSVSQAIGITIMISILTRQIYLPPSKKSEKKELMKGERAINFLIPFISPFGTLFVAWIVRKFMLGEFYF